MIPSISGPIKLEALYEDDNYCLQNLSFIYKPLSSIRDGFSCAHNIDTNHSVHLHALIRLLVFHLKIFDAQVTATDLQ